MQRACTGGVQEVVQLEIVRRGLNLYQEHIAKNKLQQSLHRAMLGSSGSSMDLGLTMSSAYGQVCLPCYAFNTLY